MVDSSVEGIEEEEEEKKKIGCQVGLLINEAVPLGKRSNDIYSGSDE